MRRLILIASFWALVASKPEMYKEKEDFQYSRSSSDAGTKAGFYGAQRGNMGGNYERAHNMDSLAQHQMSTLVRNVDGELGEGANTRTGNVFAAANSRGLYGSGNYDLSNLRGRNFGEGTILGDSLSQSALAQNAAGYSGYSGYGSEYSAANKYSSSRAQSSGLSSGYQSSDLASKYSQTDAQKAADYGARNYEYDSQGTNNYKYAQSSSHAKSNYDNINSANSDHKTGSSLTYATPVRVYIRPGTRIAIPVSAQVYDANAVQGLNSVHSGSDILDTTGQQLHYKPTNNAKHYESAYSYRKQWEKHDTIPVTVAPTEIPVPTNNELYEDAHLSQAASNQYESELASAAKSHASSANSAYLGGYSSSTKNALSSQSQHQSQAYNSGASALNAYNYGTSASNAYDAGASSSNAYKSGASDSNAYTHNAYDASLAANLHSSHISDGTVNSNNQIEDIGSRPKSYHSSYSYHKSWERRGDPYIIKPVGEQSSQRLTAASAKQGYACTYCLDDSQQRVRRSLSTDDTQISDNFHDGQKDMGQQLVTGWEQEQDLGQQAESRWQNLADLGQQTQNQWDELGNFNQQPQSQLGNLEDLGQQTQNQWDKLEDLDQQSQNQWGQLGDLSQQTQDKLEDLGQQTQTQWDNLGDLSQQTQGKLEDLGQQTQSHWGKLEDLGQQTQNQWDTLGDLSQQTQGKLEDLGQQTQSHWGKLEDLGQQTQNQWDDLGDKLNQKTQSHVGKLEDLGQQIQTQWDKLGDFGQQTQNNWENHEALNPQTQSHWGELEDLSQQTQNSWDNFESVGQQSLNKWSNLDKPDLGQHGQSQNEANFGQETQNTASFGGYQFYKPWTVDGRYVPYYTNYKEIGGLPYYGQDLLENINKRWNCHNLEDGSHFHHHNFDFKESQDRTHNSDFSFIVNHLDHSVKPVENTAQKEEDKPKIDANIQRLTTTIHYGTLEERIPVTTVKPINTNGLQKKNSTPAKIHPIDIGRGDIGPEDTWIETSNENKNYKTPEEIESLSLTKEQKDIYKEPLNLSVTSLNRQSKPDNKQKLLDELSTVIESVTTSTSNLKDNHENNNVNVISILANSTSKSQILSSSSTALNKPKQMPASGEKQDEKNILDNFEPHNWMQQAQSLNLEKNLESFDKHNEAQHFEQFVEQNMGQYLEPFEEQNLSLHSENIEKQNMAQQLEPFEKGQNLVPWEEQKMNNYGEQNLGQQIQSFDQQNLEQFLEPFEQQNMGQLETSQKSVGYLQNLDKKNSIEFPKEATGRMNSQYDFEQKVQKSADRYITQNSHTSSKNFETGPEKMNVQEQNKQFESKNNELTKTGDDISTPIEPTTEKPGFWGSAWNKTKSATDSIVSWFRS